LFGFSLVETNEFQRREGHGCGVVSSVGVELEELGMVLGVEEGGVGRLEAGREFEMWGP